MIKYSKLLILSILASSISSVYSMQETDELPKSIIKDLIIKYQIDETTYLRELLSLPRTTIQKKLNQSLTKEAQKHSECEQHYAQDLKETKNRALQIEVRLKKENNIKLLESLKIQNYLIQKYESAIKDENLAITQNNTDKMTLLIEALYLTSITEKELDENKKLYRNLSLKFHPDKLKDLDEDLKQEKVKFFQTFTPLLSDNTNNEHLNNIVKAIHAKRTEIIDQIDNPSALKDAAYFFNSTTLPAIAHGIGIAVAHKTFAQIMPRSEGENILYDNCVTSFRNTALDIETKLVKLTRHP